MLRDQNMKIIAGLGNPGKKYARTRHNIGFIIVDQMAADQNLSWQESKDWNLLMAKGTGYILIKPLTFMNDSGLAIRKIMDYYDLLPERIDASTDISDSLIVIHDELDVKLGEYKIATSSNSAGHNGIKSIIEHLGTKNFSRYRVGIATPELDKYRKSIFGNRAHKFVLNNFHQSEEATLKEVTQKIIDQLG